MATPEGDWIVSCDARTFEACKHDDKFAYIVALARAVNSLNFVHSAMICAGETPSPDATRARLNSYFFASAILYEALKLIKAMNQPFKDDRMFQVGLRLILKDKVAQEIERKHLDPARNRAVFHFFPEYFAEIIQSKGVDECLFVTAHGTARKDLYYSFADGITGGILVGFSEESERFSEVLGKAMSDTRDLMVRFINDGELLIAYHIKLWGFVAKEVKPPSDLNRCG